MSSRLIVSLGAVQKNYAALCEAAEAKVAAVVKADAYGLGACRIAAALAAKGCSDFFVATAEEGVTLRADLAEAKIFVFEGATARSVDSLASHHLTPVLNTISQCQRWLQFARPAAVHFDTGMHRLGLAEDDLAKIPDQLDVRLLVSHFARADEPLHGDNKQQIKRSEIALAAMRSRWPELELSLGNSAGLLYKQCPAYIGRAGIGLYGGNPFADRDNPTLPAVSLLADVLQLRHVPAGQALGYGGTYTTDRPTLLAVIGAGYADGLPRLLSNNGFVFVAGQRCPIVGRVSMDCVQVDVTEVSAGAVAEGDWAELVGPNIMLDEVAIAAGTISYEILTGLGRRASREYNDEIFLT